MTLQQTITEAVKAISAEGYISPQQLDYWLVRLREAAVRSLPSEAHLQKQLNEALRAVYARQMNSAAVMRVHAGVERYALAKVEPKLRTLLQSRIMASADLIKRNRQAAVEKTLQRFSGWASSVPPGGSDNVDKVEEKTHIRKSLSSLPFEERRVIIDQGHKLASNINQTIAEGAGAIAVVWHSNWRQAGYNYRVDHKERDQKVYLLRGNWAQEKGLVKPGSAGYYDDVTAFGEEPFCRCRGKYIYSLRRLPNDMLTQKGKEELASARSKIAGVR